MNKDKKIEAIINSAVLPFCTADKATLTAMSDDKIEEFHKLVLPTADNVVDGGGDAAAPAAVASTTVNGGGCGGGCGDDTPAAPVVNGDGVAVVAGAGSAAPTPVTPLTVNEFLATVPPEFRDTLTNSVALHQAERLKMEQVILNHANNTFTQAELTAKNMVDIKALHAFARPAGSYAGAGGAGVGQVVNNTQGEEVPMDVTANNGADEADKK